MVLQFLHSNRSVKICQDKFNKKQTKVEKLYFQFYIHFFNKEKKSLNIFEWSNLPSLTFTLCDPWNLFRAQFQSRPAAAAVPRSLTVMTALSCGRYLVAFRDQETKFPPLPPPTLGPPWRLSLKPHTYQVPSPHGLCTFSTLEETFINI